MVKYRRDIDLFDLHRQKFVKKVQQYIQITENELKWVATFHSIDAREDATNDDVDSPDYWESEETLYDEIDTIIHGNISGTRLKYQVKNDCYVLTVNQHGASDDIVLWFKEKKEALIVNKIILEWCHNKTIPNQEV